MRFHLSAYGVREGISEVIATTQSACGEPNAAPVGIINRGDITIKLYKGSKTLSNVLETRRIAANICADAMIFAVSALSDLDHDHFTRFRGFPVLRDADAWIIFASQMRAHGKNFFVFDLKPIAAHVNRRRVIAVNRGFNAVIEATILATRMNIDKESDMIAHYNKIVERCGGSREREAMNFVMNVLKRMRAVREGEREGENEMNEYERRMRAD